MSYFTKELKMGSEGSSRTILLEFGRKIVGQSGYKSWQLLGGKKIKGRKVAMSFELGYKNVGRFRQLHLGRVVFRERLRMSSLSGQACLWVQLASTKGDRRRNPQVVKMQGAFMIMIMIIITKTDKSITELSGLRIREHHERCLE